MSSPEFIGAASLMPMLVIAASLQMIGYILQTGILYQKKTNDLVKITIIRTLTTLSISVPFIYFLGLQGACAAALVDGVLTVFLTHRASQRYFSVQYDYKRLGGLIALASLFYVLSVPLHMLSPLVAFSAKAAFCIRRKRMTWSR